VQTVSHMSCFKNAIVIDFMALIFLFLHLHVFGYVGGHNEAPGSGDPVLPVSADCHPGWWGNVLIRVCLFARVLAGTGCSGLSWIEGHQMDGYCQQNNSESCR